MWRAAFSLRRDQMNKYSARPFEVESSIGGLQKQTAESLIVQRAIPRPRKALGHALRKPPGHNLGNLLDAGGPNLRDAPETP